MGDSTNIIAWDVDSDGILTLTIDDPNQGANTMNDAFFASIKATVERLEAEKDQLKGVVLASGKKTFFAGGDLKDLRRAMPGDLPELDAMVRNNKSFLRRLETLGLPVAAAINGAALGGGLELCLAAHHRVIVDDPRAVVGFPEVQLGLLPGAGGVVRSVRLLGIVPALSGALLQGQRLKPHQAHKLGLVDEIVSPDELLPAAKRWITSRPAGQPVLQPWDADPKYKLPGGTPAAPGFAATLPSLPANLRKQLKGARYPAPHHILAAAVEGAQVDFDGALEIEGRYFLDLVTGQVAKNMIQAFFFDSQRVNGNRGRPEGVEPWRATKAVVLGAGMMGAAIAYVCAAAGIDVVLKDVSAEAADRGKEYSERLVQRSIERQSATAQEGEALLARIVPSADPADAAGADLMVEAVFEDPSVKAQVFAEIEPFLSPDALLGSNTSTLPITGLAESVSRSSDFIGLHFFSPVDKMPLLEIINGEKTSEETTRRALDFAKQIRKTPILVNDSRGFFTSRVIITFLNEGIAMLNEGIPPATIEQASSQAGYPAPVLQLTDELNMELMARIRQATEEAAESGGSIAADHPAFAVIDTMIAAGRSGRLRGAGFYDYVDGKRAGLWSGLAELFPPVGDPVALSLLDLEERMLFAESLEALKCRDEGVIESVADANIGSILGIGYPGWTGGVLQYINGYEAADGTSGPKAFVVRAHELAATYGARFEPPASLVERAERGELYSDEPQLANV